ncbi:EAL domain-containing protein [Actinoplanes bogorensis]|uniref:EAL domain-containing protein n=1 Tax=Paractinoplanes bogorensis TaxID=1610840 RepID=A0ABS5YJN4_9ACTN|nr:EAL domain-containing protein [Actinoplanes bogorensis]MBU2663541.1 EAL domain-containing protein [Actinoplanes bogorensis]
MTGTDSDDNATDRRLRLLVGLVVVAALVVALGVIAHAYVWPTPAPDVAMLFVTLAAVLVANHMRVYVRIKSSQDGTTWGEVPVLIALVLLPGPWVVLCAAVGMTLRMIATRKSPQKAIFAVAKEVLTASTAVAVFWALDVRPSLTDPPAALIPVIVAMTAMAIVDHAAYLPVMATASHSTVRRLATQDLDMKLAAYLVRLLATLLVVAVLAFGGSLLLLLIFPLVVFCMHLWQSRRIRTREERESWQRLAEATDELNAVDLTHVLHSAASRAALLFSAVETEIDLVTDSAERTVRGTSQRVTFDGSRAGATELPPAEITAELVTHDGRLHMGVLRLRFGGPVKLTEFEQYKLRTFTSALCTAIRNATAYAELQRLNEQNAYDAAHDPLTGLANRRELYERAGEHFQSHTDEGVVALLLIDLNHFKEVNDTLGHAAGDAVLREVARRLADAAAPGDLVARLGGDEFAVLLVDLPTPALATHRAKSMLSTLERSVAVEGMQITVEAAGGIALAAGSGGVNELMRRADIAMYQAKRAGQQTATYAHSQDTADVSRLALGSELHRAVAEREFVVDFQPIVDLGSGEVVSAEALARWHHPEHGSLTPMEFLQTIERSGRLQDFADAVLDQALAASDQWREAGFDLPVAVNVSPRSLLDPRFPETVLSRLGRHEVPADRLIFELAETLTLSQLDVVGRALTELSEAGVRLALDDFGTGVTPLSVLSHIPVHQLKIDREFIGAVQTSSEASAVIRSTVDLARSLHLSVIADGVESEPQRHALWSLGCVAGQGHLFARPMSAARLLATMQRGTAGRPGALAPSLHDGGAVVRMSRRRSGGSGRSALPHLPA